MTKPHSPLSRPIAYSLNFEDHFFVNNLDVSCNFAVNFQNTFAKSDKKE
jgi:hypothetical protein